MSTQGALNPVDDLASESRVVRAAAKGRPIITTEHERALRAELDRLRHQLEIEFAERLREARYFGGAEANDDYMQIKEEEAVLAAGIARIQIVLETALVIDETEAGKGVVTLGSVVEVRDPDTGKSQKLRLIGGHERLSADVVSAGSPVGQALMGRRAGHAVEVSLPNGRRRKLEIVSVREARRPDPVTARPVLA
jgi:transcription elongation factor GreA